MALINYYLVVHVKSHGYNSIVFDKIFNELVQFSLVFLFHPPTSPPAWQRVEEAQQERRELLKAMRLLQEEKQQLQEEQKRLAREREQERETCCLLRTHNQVRQKWSDVKKRDRNDSLRYNKLIQRKIYVCQSTGICLS